MSQPNESFPDASITAAGFDAAALNDFDRLRPVGTSNSEPGGQLPVRRTRRLFQGILNLNSGRPFSKTETLSFQEQAQNECLSAPENSTNAKSPTSEQQGTILPAEPMESSSKASGIQSGVIPMHAPAPKEHGTESAEMALLHRSEYDALTRGLQDDLYKHMVKYQCTPCKREFLPTRKLIKILDVPSLEKVLRKYDSILKKTPRLHPLRLGSTPDPTSGQSTAGTRTAIITAAEKIYGNIDGPLTARSSALSEHGTRPLPSNKTSYDKSFVKILAVLILIDRPAWIKHFLDEGICDADLPLLQRPGPKGNPCLRRRSTLDEPLGCAEGWCCVSVKRFETYQWKFLAPSFKRGRGKRIHHELFDSKAILPFTYYGKHIESGGFGEVTQVKIHPDYHTFEKQLAYKGCFAVKRLRSQENCKPAFDREVAILRRHSNDLTHQHLISLLCTYEQDGLYHLIFPWAKTDLSTFWKTITFINRGKTLRWLAEQCQGIAEGLSHLHHHATHSGTSLVHKDSKEGLEELKSQMRSSPQDGNAYIRLFGRHGDIKPENILWFPGPRMGWKREGILKLADFGVADFSTRNEDDENFNADRHRLTAQSPTYRSPENDFEDQRIGSSYDIWGLGCVYLEFIAWWFGGWCLVSKFCENRKADDAFWTQKKELKEVVLKLDTFFEIKDDTAVAKTAVTNFINDLEHRHESTKFTDGFLMMIKRDMLVAIGKDQVPRRKSAKQVAMKINELRESQSRILAQTSSPRS